VRLQLALAAASVVLAAAGYGASFLPSIYERSEFWTSSPTFFLLRVGLVTLLLPVAYFWERAPWRGVISRWSLLEEFGTSSLFVYWVHVEMVYGFISRPIRRHFTLEGAILAYVLFTALILSLVLFKNRWTRLRKARPLTAAGPTPAPVQLV
jgi:hypothetical protein